MPGGSTRLPGWVLQHATIHNLADGFVTGTVHLYDEHRHLVGLATQRATVRFI